MGARVVLLVTSPRLPAGLLSAHAWELLRDHPVRAGSEHPQVAAVRAQGVPVRLLDPPGGARSPGSTASALLAEAAAQGTVVWLASPDGDEGLARALGAVLAREPARAALELLPGSWDPPGARLLDAVAVVDRLLAPGGDPWKRRQTHRSLAPYLVEECYETYDAIESGDLAALREELGDLLLQVVLHARLAASADPPWTVDDVAGDLVAKLIRRSPHVFGDVPLTDLDGITAQWERIKREEKGRASAVDGIALSQPALALAAKVCDRSARAGLPTPQAGESYADERSLGAALLSVVAAARAAGQDPEAALRRAALAHLASVRSAESPARPAAPHPAGREDA